MTFQRWAQLGDICASLESVLKKNAVPEEVQSLDRLQSTPPHLDLQQYVPNVMLRLEACDFSTHLNPGIRPILEATLVERCRRLQQSFEEAWYRLQGDSPARHMAEQALQTLHVKRFQEDAAQDLQLLTEILQRYAGETSRNDQIDKSSGSEWTDETRALMERVYQQHPKLEAHEKKLLAEVSGLSLRQISIWFANQRQRRGRRMQQLENAFEEDEEEDEDTASTPFRSSYLSSSTSSSIGRCPSPVTPASINSACPSLSSSTSSRTSSDSWSATFSPVPPPPSVPFQFGSSLSASQAPTFAFSQPVPPPSFDIDQLLRQLTPPQVATPETTNDIAIPVFSTTTEEETKGPFAFKDEDEDSSTSTQTTPPSSMESLQWLPINTQGLLLQVDSTLSASQSLEDSTPQASQTVFAPLQLDTSQYLKQSPSANVDLSSIIDSFNADDFWNSFASSNNIPALPSVDPLPSPKRQKGQYGVAIAQSDTNWSDAFFKDIDTWGKPPQLAQPQMQF